MSQPVTVEEIQFLIKRKFCLLIIVLGLDSLEEALQSHRFWHTAFAV